VEDACCKDGRRLIYLVAYDEGGKVAFCNEGRGLMYLGAYYKEGRLHAVMTEEC